MDYIQRPEAKLLTVIAKSMRLLIYLGLGIFFTVIFSLNGPPPDLRPLQNGAVRGKPKHKEFGRNT